MCIFLTVIIRAEIDTPKAASLGITRKGINKNTAAGVFVNSRKDRWFRSH
jgi:hypothetical protein